ncbi:MAG: AAA+ family ATPase [Alphaproteobacteria bacterium]
MKLALALILAAAPALAQEAPPTPAPEAEEDGFSLMEEGAKLLFRGLMTEMQPAIDEMGKAMEEMGPALEGLGEEIGPKIRQLIAMIDDFRNYDAPVMLPNGDILIRRNAPLVPQAEPTPGPNGEIEL